LILGTGKRLFAAGSTVSLKLVEAKSLGSEVVILTYQPEEKA
jgi:hypothetical protein